MAKKTLSFIDLVTGADTDTLRAALEARSKIDELLVLRHEAYRKIAELEEQVNNIVGDEGTFEFDAPEFDVAFGGKSPKKKAPTKSTSSNTNKTQLNSDEDTDSEDPIEDTPKEKIKNTVSKDKAE
ncbi:hypothetical protein PQO03_18600 [Lentisphaera profundi]|uniref:Uncharacterized protein n=1 Tax=Lentisphaera profundi TaxID=1658616 RepID=A0ABY7VYQ0_9BACT|nr:hypothetical protein [Lentisphaera profundi]WDE97839.1 hypothetical protein PQO03_18600 [Lentisphaera profundi]